MAGYWSLVPRGTWKVIDSEDTIEVLRDNESRATYDPKFNRINVFGPDHKAVIIDLNVILSQLDLTSGTQFIKLIESMLGVTIVIN